MAFRWYRLSYRHPAVTGSDLQTKNSFLIHNIANIYSPNSSLAFCSYQKSLPQILLRCYYDKIRSSTRQRLSTGSQLQPCGGTGLTYQIPKIIHRGAPHSPTPETTDSPQHPNDITNSANSTLALSDFHNDTYSKSSLACRNTQDLSGEDQIRVWHCGLVNCKDLLPCCAIVLRNGMVCRESPSFAV